MEPHGKNQNRGELTIVRSGIHQSGAVKPGAPSLSYLYYVLYLEGYDPFHPRSDDDGFLQPGFVKTDADRRWFNRNTQIYRETKWEGLKSNLRLNSLCVEGDLVKLDVHYRFLSAYAHPIPVAYDLVYGRNRPTNSPKYDHYASELSLLYTVHFAADELRDFRALADREPRVDIANWEEIDADVEQARELAHHLWYVGDPPHAYDFFDEANSRSFRDRRWERGHINIPPESIPPEEVRYYHNPLERLKRLHWSVVEGLTGFQYVSPWPRADAWR